MATDREKDRAEIQLDRVVADALKPEAFPRTVDQLCEEVIKLRKEVDYLQKEGLPGRHHENILEQDAIISYINARSTWYGIRRIDLNWSPWFQRYSPTEWQTETGRRGEHPLSLVYDTSIVKNSKKPESESGEVKMRELEAKIHFLENQLKNDKPHLQLYKIGAGGFLMGAASLALWAVSGIAAPFHPIFAAVTIPASLGVIAMAILIRRIAYTQHNAS